MSFYSYKNANCNCCPGSISSGEGFGCTERICAQIKKVYDACLEQDQIDRTVTVTSVTPGNVTPVEPITFISCRSTSVSGTIEDLIIDRLTDRPKFARVRAAVCIPLELVFVDAADREFVAQSSIIVNKDVILYVPVDSLIPYELNTIVNAVCVSGSYAGNGRFNITVCISVILKIVAEVDLLIPAYGFTTIPPCESFAENVCDEFFRLPLYPPQETCGCYGGPQE